jgi:hypothetical protein
MKILKQHKELLRVAHAFIWPRLTQEAVDLISQATTPEELETAYQHMDREFEAMKAQFVAYMATYFAFPAELPSVGASPGDRGTGGGATSYADCKAVS